MTPKQFDHFLEGLEKLTDKQLSALAKITFTFYKKNLFWDDGIIPVR